MEEVKTPFDSLWTIEAKDIDGTSKNLGEFAEGKKCIVVVNVASGWGLTDEHYKSLVKMHEAYKEQGFEIFAFPCN